MVKVLHVGSLLSRLSAEDLKMLRKQQDMRQQIVDKAAREHPGHKLVRSQVVREGDRYMLYMRFEPDPDAIKRLYPTTQEKPIGDK